MEVRGDVGSGPREQVALTRLAHLLELIDRRLTRLSLLTVALLVVVVSVLKRGIDLGAPGFGEVFSLQSWPEPVNQYPYSSYGVRIIAWVLQVEDVTSYLLIGVVLSTGFAALVTWRVSKHFSGRSARFALLILLGGPTVWVLSGRFVHTDAFALAGAVLFVLSGRRMRWALVAAVLALLGAPEQAIVIFLGAYLLSLTTAFRDYRRNAAAGLALVAVGQVVLWIWASQVGVESRVSLLPDLVRRSIEIGLSNFPLTLYSGYGVGILVLSWTTLSANRREIPLVLAASLLIPLGVTLVTGDQTRVLVIASLATISMSLAVYGKLILASLDLHSRWGLGAAAVLIALLPAVEVQGWNVTSPWVTYFSLVQRYAIDPLPL